MKKTLSLILAVLMLLPGLASCGTEEQKPADTGVNPAQTENAQTGETTPTVNESAEEGGKEKGIEPAETEPLRLEPDYSDFVMPEETGKLVVYADASMGRSVMNPAIRIFGELYPGVEVDYKTMSEDEFEAAIRTEIPAGRGPDLLLFSSSDIPDVYKTASAGLFTDLNPYFALDGEIDLSDFIVPVMDAGVLKGQRFFVPLNYDLPLMVAVQSTLDEIGMTEDEVKTSDGFFEAAARFHELYPDGSLYIDTFGGPRESGDIQRMCTNFGFRFINYETGEIEIDEEMFRRCADLVKLYYDPDFDPKDTHLVQESDGWYNQGWAIWTKHCLFDDMGADLSGMDIKTLLLGEVGDKPVQLAATNQRDGITANLNMNTAIPTGSANKLNAWRLLKILLSDDIQGGHDETRWGLPYFWVGYPVRKSSLKGYLWEEGMVEDETFIRFCELVQSPTEARSIPQIIKRYIGLEILPYVRGERSWEDCYKRFLNTLELYASE